MQCYFFGTGFYFITSQGIVLQFFTLIFKINQIIFQIDIDCFSKHVSGAKDKQELVTNLWLLYETVLLICKITLKNLWSR